MGNNPWMTHCIGDVKSNAQRAKLDGQVITHKGNADLQQAKEQTVKHFKNNKRKRECMIAIHNNIVLINVSGKSTSTFKVRKV